MRMQSRLNVISKPDMQWIHAASLKILAETGIVFHSEEALTICRNHGAKVDGKTVCFPKKLVGQVLESCPNTFRWKARNDEQSVTVGDPRKNYYYNPTVDPYLSRIWIKDAERPP